MKKQLSIALGAGVLAALCAGMYLSSVSAQYKQNARTVPVLVARTYIDHGQVLDASHVKVMHIPRQYVQPRALTRIEDLQDMQGKALFVSQVTIEEGEQLLTSKLLVRGQTAGMSMVVPEHMRAVTHTFNRETMHQILHPGDHVDIICVFEVADVQGNIQHIAKLVLQDVLVLGVDARIIGGVEDSSSAASPDMRAARAQLTHVPVTFSVLPHDAGLLQLAAEKGSLALALRAPGDRQCIEETEIREHALSPLFAQCKQKGAAHEHATPAMGQIQKQYKEAIELLKRYKK